MTVPFSLQVDRAIGKAETAMAWIHGRAMLSLYKAVFAKTPRVTGTVRRAIKVQINGKIVGPLQLLDIKTGDEVQVGSNHPALDRLENGYPNPGNVHWSAHKTGIIIRQTAGGWMVIRTLKASGRSTKAKEGMIKFGRTAFAREFRNGAAKK